MAAMEAETIRALLAQAFPEAVEVTVEDRTGTGDHFQVAVTSSVFDGEPLRAKVGLQEQDATGAQEHAEAQQHQPARHPPAAFARVID